MKKIGDADIFTIGIFIGKTKRIGGIFGSEQAANREIWSADCSRTRFQTFDFQDMSSTCLWTIESEPHKLPKLWPDRLRQVSCQLASADPAIVILQIRCHLHPVPEESCR